MEKARKKSAVDYNKNVTEHRKNAIVLAAGKGTRMKSDAPKVLHKVLGVSMAEMIVHTLKKAGAQRIITVTGYGHEQVEKVLAGQCEFALQEPQLGTGHAVQQARQLEGDKGVTLVVNGDAPCLQKETFEALFASVPGTDMTILAGSLADAGSYGRVLRDEAGRVTGIVEAKDATPQQRKVHEFNVGIYAFDNEKLWQGLKELKNDNVQHEYYITDLVGIFLAHGWQVRTLIAQDVDEVQGVNDNVELARANAWLRRKINTAWMQAGVTMVDPETTYIGPYVKFGHDVVVHPGVSIYGSTMIGNHVTILPGVMITDAHVADDTIIPAYTCITKAGEENG